MKSLKQFTEESAERQIDERAKMHLHIKHGAFHRWLGKSEDEPITDADIQRGLAAGGHAAKMANFAKNARRWHHEGVFRDAYQGAKKGASISSKVTGTVARTMAPFGLKTVAGVTGKVVGGVTGAASGATAGVLAGRTKQNFKDTMKTFEETEQLDEIVPLVAKVAQKVVPPVARAAAKIGSSRAGQAIGKVAAKINSSPTAKATGIALGSDAAIGAGGYFLGRKHGKDAQKDEGLVYGNNIKRDVGSYVHGVTKAAFNKEEAPPGDKYERMVHHIKGKHPSKKQKEIAYATAWKAYNKSHHKEETNLDELHASPSGHVRHTRSDKGLVKKSSGYPKYGAIAGAIAGNLLSRNRPSRVAGTLIGAAVGGLAGATQNLRKVRRARYVVKHNK